MVIELCERTGIDNLIPALTIRAGFDDCIGEGSGDAPQQFLDFLKRWDMSRLSYSPASAGDQVVIQAVIRLCHLERNLRVFS